MRDGRVTRKTRIKKKCYVMITISSISSLWSITKCDTQSPQMSVMNDLKRHTYLSLRKAMKRSIAFWMNRIRTARTYVNIFFHFIETEKGTGSQRGWAERYHQANQVRERNLPITNIFESFICMKRHHKIYFFLFSLSNFNTFAARPMKTKRIWLRKSKKRRFGVCYM